MPTAIDHVYKAEAMSVNEEMITQNSFALMFAASNLSETLLDTTNAV